jgi:alpha-glucosidase
LTVSGWRSGRWWRTAVFYQIYPRSFADSDADGIGDLPGLTAHLDYLRGLGVDALWLSPFYRSPMRDFGYDVTDHSDVDPVFGTLRDFDTLLEEAHRRDLRVLIDFIPNHTSDLHPWFRDARASREAPRRDWYIWARPRPDGGPPNNWLSTFPATGSAWTLDPRSGECYLHSYTAHQPDLNWRNPEVRAAMVGVLHFWLERGVDGFRVDAPHRLIKDAALRDNPPRIASARTALTADAGLLRHIDQPEVHAVLRELRAVVAAHGGDRVLVGEVGVADPRRWAAYRGRDDELDLLLNFRVWSQPWSAPAFAAAIAVTELALAGEAWPLYALGNHDLPRLASRLARDGDGAARSRVAAMLLCTLRGAPLLYYGDEIGMTDVPVPSDQAHDPNGRDPQRAPMRWAPGPNAGFCPPGLAPWLPVGVDPQRINVESEDGDPASLLSLYRRLIAMRRSEPALLAGAHRRLRAAPSVLAYQRVLDGAHLTVALNFSSRPVTVSLPGAGGEVLISTNPGRRPNRVGVDIDLEGDEGVVLRP